MAGENYGPALVVDNGSIGPRTEAQKLKPLRRDSSSSTLEDMTREEIEAKLEAVEARSDTKFEKINASVERVAEIVERLALDVQRTSEQARADSLFTRWTLAGIALAIVGTFIGVLAFGGDQFGAGRDMGSALAALDAKMDRIEASQADAAKSPQAKPPPITAPK